MCRESGLGPRRMIDALGGEAGCRRLSAAFYGRVAKDPALRTLFPGKSLRCAIEELSAFLVQFLDGDEAMTQYRWWLSLRESHSRFEITELQRAAWLNQMEATLTSSEFDGETQAALHRFFTSAAAYLLGQKGETVDHPELAGRWNRTMALDRLVEAILAGRDDEVLLRFRDFSSSPSIFVGVLSRMLQTGRATLVHAVTQAIAQDPSLASHRYGGRSLLHYAAGAGCVGVANELLGIGVDADVLDSGNHTPLYRAANECRTESGALMVRILIGAGADVNYSSKPSRCSPLHMAARRGSVGVAQALLDAGADPNARDANGHTPLDRAVRCRKWAVVELLEGRTPV